MRTAPLALILGAVACVVALVAGRRKGRWRGVLASPPVPTEVDRAGFATLGEGAATRPWLLATFTERTCRSCAGTLDRLGALGGPDVAVVAVELADRPDLHERYEVDTVPLTLLVDTAGVVQAWVLGPATAGDVDALRGVIAGGGAGWGPSKG